MSRPAPMTRLHSVTRKIPTRFGSLYAAICFDDAGRVEDIAISYPGKHEDSEVGRTLDALREGLTTLVAEIRAVTGKNGAGE